MKILALDFSSAQRSAALVDASNPAAPRVLGRAAESGGRNTRSLTLVDAVLKEAQLEREAIATLALGLGPGSYTGIRAALALAQGWQMARPVTTIGLSTTEVLAVAARQDASLTEISVAIDAQRGEFYVATWNQTNGIWQETEALHIVSLEEIKTRLTAGKKIIGPELADHFPGQSNTYPDATVLGQLAALAPASAARPAPALEPIYLREVNFVKAPPPRVIA